MNKLTRGAVVAACAMLSTTTFAIDLIGSYQKAREADPAMRAADEALAAGREKAVQGSALFRPQVSLSASVTQIEDKSSTSGPLTALAAGSGRATEAALQLKQPVYSAKNTADQQQLQQQSELAAISHRGALQDLLQQVGEVYFDLLLAQENLRVALAEKAAVGLQRDRAQARFEVGRGKVTDLQEAQARYDAVLTKEVSASSTLALRQAKYEALTGSGETLAGLAPGFVPAAPLPDDLAVWQGKAQDHNLRVLAKRHELLIANADLGRYRLEGRPTLDLVASVGHKGQSGSLSPLIAPDGSRVAAVGLQFSVPLYSGGALNSRERETVAKARQAEQELAAAMRDARLQVQDSFLAVKTGVARVAAVAQQVLSAQTALDATTLGRDVGSRTELDVLDAQQRLYASQLDLAQARRDHLLARLRLAAAAGELDESDLMALNTHLRR